MALLFFLFHTYPGCQSKINDLDWGACGVDTHNVLRFEVQVDDVLLMHVTDALQDLLHVVHAGRLRVLKVVVHDALKQLAACNTATQTNRSKRKNAFKGAIHPKLQFHPFTGDVFSSVCETQEWLCGLKNVNTASIDIGLKNLSK